MKKLLVLMSVLMLVCGSADAKRGKFHPAIMLQQDGTQVECVARYPDGVYAKDIQYKVNREGKIQKIKSDEIKTIRYFLEDDSMVELDRSPFISMMNLYKDKKKYSKPIWLNVNFRGPVTFYVNVLVGKYTSYDYYCKRESEEAASDIVGISKHFAKVGSEYFADNPEISEKIRKKEKGYSARNIEAIVKEYNAWKLAQNGK